MVMGGADIVVAKCGVVMCAEVWLVVVFQGFFVWNVKRGGLMRCSYVWFRYCGGYVRCGQVR